ncbi:MAG: hypothetical protein L3J44_00040 [Campylobacteraceae bacterium]|nr:hypothetical protein [Campylobacteraceae bacterium]
MMKYINIFIFAILSILYLSFYSHIKFSTNFIDIFLSQESLQLFNVAKKLGLSNEIFISKRGFDEKSLKQLNEIAKKLDKIPKISKVTASFGISSNIKQYFKKNYYLLADFNDTKLTRDDIYKRLQNIKKNIYNSVLYEPINRYDPLNLFHISFKQTQKYLKLKNFGYVIKAETSVNTSNAQEARVVYDKIQSIISDYKGVIAFSPFFYLVENSAFIKADAQKIMMISTVLLLFLYFVMLKNHKLFLNAIIAVTNSILIAILLSTLFFKSISILAVVFGVSVTSVSIDYMFHYYFHGYFSQKKLIFQKRVFFGFFTTVGVFIIFSFIDIELFAQLAIFSVISLSMAYVLFTFVFRYLEIKNPVIKSEEKNRYNPNSYFILLISVFFIGYCYVNLKFDNNLKNLDYHNTKLLNLSKKFKNGLQNDRYKAIIIEAKNQEALLQKYEKIEKKYPNILGIGKFILSHKKCNQRVEKLQNYNFDKVKKVINIEAKSLGFSDIFKVAYAGINSQNCDMKIINDIKFKIIKNAGNYYTLALINKNKIKARKLFNIVDLGKSLAKDTKSMKDRLEIYMFISVFFIIFVLFLTFGLEMFYPLTYLLFPISVVLFFISLVGKINIMHIFALVILIAISIDYGIYLHKTTTMSETKKAINYALLSTFFGFGVLIFSKTVALHSIGFVITVGIGSICFLLYGKILSLKR